jgi:hypothetical protein
MKTAVAIIVAGVLSASVTFHMQAAQAQSQSVGQGISTQTQPTTPPQRMTPGQSMPQPMPGQFMPGTATAQVADAAELQSLAGTLKQLMQGLDANSKQLQNDPQSAALAKLMYAQGSTMNNVIGVLLKQAQAGASLPPDAQTKMLVAQKQAAAAAPPTIIDQQRKALQAFIDLQEKLMGISKAPPPEQAKQQSLLVSVQSGLLQVQSRLYTIMLAEMAK